MTDETKAKPERATRKLSLRLASGELAYAVAVANGVSDALFHMRVARGLSPEEVVKPPLPRGRPKAVSVRSAAGASSPAASVYDKRRRPGAPVRNPLAGCGMASPGCRAIICASAGERLTLGPRLRFYILETWAGAGWIVERFSPTASDMRRWLALRDAAPSGELMAAAAALPDDPADYLASLAPASPRS